MRLIAILTSLLKDFYEFHSIREDRAKKGVKQLEEELELDVEYFGDSDLINKEKIEKRICEFADIASQSMQMMLQVAESQSHFWEAKKDALPREVSRVLVFEYDKLWMQLNGPARDVRWQM